MNKSELESLREEIDQIDSEIVKLLNLRVGKACEIGKIKQVSGVDPYDPAREEQVFKKLSGYSDGPLREVSLRAVYREVISASIALEKDMTIGYLGPEATYTHQAAVKNFGSWLKYQPLPDIPDVFLAVAAYQQLANAIDCPLHIGITEAGGLRAGTVKSAIGLGSRLWAGIGDTVRVSLSADPAEEVRVASEMLKSLGLRRRGVTVISCPSCARQQFDVIKTVQEIEERLAHINTPLTVSIIACVVNGPGEAALTDVGITGGKNGNNMLYLSGIQSEKVLTKDMIEKVVSEIEKKASEQDNN